MKTIPLEPFEPLSGRAQLWVYAFSRPLSPDDEDKVRQVLDNFVAGWNSHDTPVRGAYTIAYRHFVLLAGETHDGISGCSIDNSVATFKHLRDQHQLDALDRSLIFFRDGEGHIRAVDRPTFRRAVKSGDVHARTPVFDTTIQTITDLREGLFEIAFAESWHARLFAGLTPSSTEPR